MVDPRIYRASWVIVLVALIVFGFSLQDRPSGATTNLAPGANFSSAYANARSLAASYGVVSPGSAADEQMAGTLARQLRQVSGFTVTTQTVATRTIDGEQAIATVEAERPGLSPGTIVVLANRDGATSATAKGVPIAATAASAVLVDLARSEAGATVSRSLLLVSTSGSVGAAGATQLVHSLGITDIDAVITLEDVAAASVSNPVAVPWSGTDQLSPPMLVATIDSALGSQAHITSGYPSLGSELAQLAFPYATGSQAPFTNAGVPAVGISLSGDRLPTSGEAVSAARMSRMGLAIEEAVDALDGGSSVPPPSTYLTIGSEMIPLWAFRLLVLGLILPVAITLVDALARARRRGHSVLSWMVWVISGIAPFLIGFIVIKLAGLSHLLSAPSGAVASGASLSAAGAATIAVALAAIAVAFRVLRPVGVQLASGIGWRRTPTSPVIEGAVVALSIVLCGLALIVWLFNPFAAALLVAALHLWMWVGSPGVIVSRVRTVALLLLGLVLPALVAVYFMLSLGMAPWMFAWSLTLALAGGAVGVGTALSWCVTLGVLAGLVVLLRRTSRAAAVEADAPVTTRGPLGYAGPGALGGTESALRR